MIKITNVSGKLESLALEGIVPEDRLTKIGSFEVDKTRGEVTIYINKPTSEGDIMMSAGRILNWDIHKFQKAVGKHDPYYLLDREHVSIDFESVGRALLPFIRQYGNYSEPMEKHLGFLDVPASTNEDIGGFLMNSYLQHRLPFLLNDTANRIWAMSSYLENQPSLSEFISDQSAESILGISDWFDRLLNLEEGYEKNDALNKLGDLALEGILPAYSDEPLSSFEVDTIQDTVTFTFNSGLLTENPQDSIPFLVWDGADTFLETVGRYDLRYQIPQDGGMVSVDVRDVGRALVPLVGQYGNYREPLKEHFSFPSDLPNEVADRIGGIAVASYLSDGLAWLVKQATYGVLEADRYLKKNADLPEDVRHHPEVIRMRLRFYDNSLKHET